MASGARGAIGAGEGVDAAGTLVFELIAPNGTVALQRDEDRRLGEDFFESRSFRHTPDGWTPNQTLTWRRVRE